MPAIVYRSPGAHSASWMTWPPSDDLVRDVVGAHRRLAAALERGRGGDRPWRWSRAGKTSCTGMSVAWAASVMVDGLNVGHCAMASTAPVCGWMITTVQLSALVLSTCCAHACSAAYWSAGTIVSRRSLPFTTGLSRLPASGICWPSSDLHLLAARLAGQQRVVLFLEPGSADQHVLGIRGQLGTGEPDDVGRDVALRVGPRVVGRHPDAGQVKRRDLGADRRAARPRPA